MGCYYLPVLRRFNFRRPQYLTLPKARLWFHDLPRDGAQVRFCANPGKATKDDTSRRTALPGFLSEAFMDDKDTQKNSWRKSA